MSALRSRARALALPVAALLAAGCASYALTEPFAVTVTPVGGGNDVLVAWTSAPPAGGSAVVGLRCNGAVQSPPPKLQGPTHALFADLDDGDYEFVVELRDREGTPVPTATSSAQTAVGRRIRPPTFLAPSDLGVSQPLGIATLLAIPDPHDPSLRPAFDQLRQVAQAVAACALGPTVDVADDRDRGAMEDARRVLLDKSAGRDQRATLAQTVNARALLVVDLRLRPGDAAEQLVVRLHDLTYLSYPPGMFDPRPLIFEDYAELAGYRRGRGRDDAANATTLLRAFGEILAHMAADPLLRRYQGFLGAEASPFDAGRQAALYSILRCALPEQTTHAELERALFERAPPRLDCERTTENADASRSKRQS